MAHSQQSVDTPSRKRRDSDNDIPNKRHDDGARKTSISDVRFLPCNADFSNLDVDHTQYIAMVIPKSMQTAFEIFLKDFFHKNSPQHSTVDLTNENDVELDDSQTSTESLQQKFLKDFGGVKNKLNEKLESFQESDLKRDVSNEQFETFRNYRKKLTKWYVSCQHLANKITSNSASSRYMKTTVSFSPAVNDSGLKQSCTAKIRKTEKTCEQTLTDHVLSVATALNDEVFTLLCKCIADADRSFLKMLVKAYRVVTRANRYLTKQAESRDNDFDRPTRQFRNRRRSFHYNRERRNFHRQPNRRQPYRRQNNRYESDFPPLRRENYNYRQFKRRPNFSDRVDTDDDDDVFVRNPRRFSRGSFRRNSYRQ